MNPPDYRTGPQKLFAAMRGELLGPVDTKLPDAANPGKTLKFYHKMPNGSEANQIYSTQRGEGGATFEEFIIRARDASGELIFDESELQMVLTQFPPLDMAEIVIEMRKQCDKASDDVLDVDLGNTSGQTQEPGTS